MPARAKPNTAPPKPAPRDTRPVARKPQGKAPVRLFVSYSHTDAAARARLEQHLAPWLRDEVSIWWDENIEPGASLDAEIAKALRSAHIFVALLSPAFLASNYCWNIEWKRAMRRRQLGKLRVVAVVVRPNSWRYTEAANLKLLPRDGREPERWKSHDAAYVDVARGIDVVIRSVRKELAAAPAKPPRKRAPAKLKAASGVGPPQRGATAKVRRPRKSQKP